MVVLLGIQFGSGFRGGRLKDSNGKAPKQTQTVPSSTNDGADIEYASSKGAKAIQITLDLITSAIQRWRPPKPTVILECPVGLLVTPELEHVLATCKAKVERISKECRAGNRKFRWALE